MNKKLNNILYLIIREDLDSPLIKSQCLDVIDKCENKIFVVNLYSFELLLKSIKKREKNKIISLPFFHIGTGLNRYKSIFLIVLNIATVFFLVKKYRINIIHARSYNSGALALYINKIFGIRYIFDPRSDYIEENRKNLKVSIKDEKFWKNLEKKIVYNSIYTITTSSHLLKEYESSRKLFYIPNNYPSSFSFSSLTKKSNNKDFISLVYIGSINKWNDINLYVTFFEKLKKIVNFKIEFSIITHSNIEDFYKLKLIEKNIKLIRAQQDQIPSIVSKFDIGIYLMSNVDSRLGVKTVEYLYTGLPMIVSKNILGAASIIKKNNLGIVIDENLIANQDEINTFLESVKNNRVEWFNKCHNYAVEEFSPETTSTKLNTLYKK